VMFYNAMLWSEDLLSSSTMSSIHDHHSVGDDRSGSDPSPCGSISSCVSESRDPSRSSSSLREKKCVTMLVALRDISPGEELFVGKVGVSNI
jgi:hypothetical protein